MTWEELLDTWEKDAKYDRTELGEESLKTPQLHHKYRKFYAVEWKELRRIETEYKRLRHEKQNFYLQGPHEDTPKDWKLPPRGKVIRAEVQDYLDVDPDVIEAALALGVQNEKIALLESIQKRIDGRNWDVGRAIEWIKHLDGK